MSELRFRAGGADPDTLAVGEATIRGARDGDLRYWLMWFVVARVDNGQPELFAVAVNPGGDYIEKSEKNRRTWGLKRAGEGRWQVLPSINCGDTVWHQTPALVDVPDGEPWP